VKAEPKEYVVSITAKVTTDATGRKLIPRKGARCRM